MQAIFASDPVKGQVKVGELDFDTGTLIKQVNRAKHYFRLVKGYAIQAEAFTQLKRLKASGIEIDETDTGQRLYAPLEVWEESGGIWNGLNGRQRTLSEKYFEKL